MKKYFYAIGAISLLFGACDTAEEPEIVRPASAELRLTSVATMDMATRVEDSNFDQDKKFNVKLLAVDALAEETGVASYTGGAWALADEIHLSPKDRTLVAWAPEAMSATSNQLEMKSAKYTADADLLYFKQVVHSGAADVPVLFAHSYAQLTFKLVADATYVGGDKILGELSVNGIPDTAKFDLSDGTLKDQSTTAVALTLVTGGSAEFDANGYSALVVPGASTNLEVSCTLDGQAFNGKTLNVPTFEAGNNYEVTLKVKGTDMTIQSVKVKGWNTVSSTVDLN